jgi:hypothetical protein
MAGLYNSPFAPIPPVKKRRAFFSFHYDDIMRVNNARNSWKIDHPEADNMRNFYDGSLWESKKLQGPDALKRLVREGVQQTSAVCVLVGTHTWSRRWVRYEIARAVIDNRGLLAVHINNINHHQYPYGPHPLGHNPLAWFAIGKDNTVLYQPPKYYLHLWNGNAWERYKDYTDPVSRPAYVPDMLAGHLTQLSAVTPIYDFKQHQGHKNMGSWIDSAAITVGR